MASIEPISPLLSPSMESLSSAASSRNSLHSNTSTPVVPESESVRTPGGRLPGTQLVGPSSSHVLSKALGRSGGGGVTGNGREKLEKKRTPSPNDPLVLKPFDMQAALIRFQAVTQGGQVVVQVAQDGQQLVNSNQGYSETVNNVTSPGQ